MRTISLGAAFALLLGMSVSLSAQKNKNKLADVTASDVSAKVYAIDSGANGVYIANIGSSVYEVDNAGGFNIIFKKHSRIHLLNRNAFDEATITIPLYMSGSLKEKILTIDAHTYTLQDGKLVDTKLEKSAVFEEKVNDNVMLAKFTMPKLQEGCIVDINYTVSLPFERVLNTWYFQESLPVLYSEYTCSVPQVYDFIIIKQGYNAAKPVENKLVPAVFYLRNSESANRAAYFTLNTNVSTNKWVMENIPKTSSESFSSTLINRIDKIEFQLSAIRYTNEPVRQVMSSWSTAAQQLLMRNDFGADLANNAGWTKDEVQKIVGKSDPTLDAAKKIYRYVRDNFTCKDHSALYTENNLKKVFQAKSGNVAEINLLLAAMLRSAGFWASPIILSTRDHGKALELYPVMDRFNYVICGLEIDGKAYFLDASFSKLGFAKLHKNNYNGFGRIIDLEPKLVEMMPDSLLESSTTSVILFANEKDELEGQLEVNYDNNGSFEARETIAKTPIDEFFKSTVGSLPADYHPSGFAVDSLTSYDDPLKVRCSIKLDKTEDDIIYFNPIVYGGRKENPFAASERKYPIEMESAINEVYTLIMDIPHGYKVDEMPKLVRVSFNENEGMFEYLVYNNGTSVQLKCTLLLNKATFEPEDYQYLREFFGFVVKKQSEQIVFKKL